MKTIVSIVAFAVLFGVAPSRCFALWEVADVSVEEAKELGMEIRLQAAGSNHVGVELEFKTEGKFKAFGPEGKYKDRSRVELTIGPRDNPLVTAALREDRSKAGSVVVGFTADRVQLVQTNLRVNVPYQDGGAGGITYVLRGKDLVELKKDR
jgi:hypothetical protein